LTFKKNILIVGGTGFIGYHLAKKVLKKGWRVTSVSSNPPKKIRYLSKVNYIICDITKKKLINNKIRKNFNYVVNLGGYVDHSNKKKTFKSHYAGCKNLVEIFLNKNITSFVQMGSSVEYGNFKSPHKEIMKCRVNSLKSVYSKAKLLSSLYLNNLYKKKIFPFTVLRLYLAYGPRQDFNRFIPIIIKGCLKNNKFPCSNGNQYKDFVYVEDVTDAIVKSLTNKNARGQIINIGSGKPKKLKKIIEYIKKKINGGHPQYGKIKLRKDEILKTYPNIRKAKKKINWKPKISFAKGLKSTIKYYNEQTIQ
jgi:nucleoside-diphosphate-sugar epimerase|tara:strand:- start:703 stop:1626 length:924 start_codon:yes stop_codon:yes gene_type:complete